VQVDDSGSPAPFTVQGGFLYNANGQLEILMSLPGGAPLYNNGVRVNQVGAVPISAGGAIAYYAHGWPLTIDGALCIDSGAPVTPPAVARFTAAGQSITTPRVWAPLTGQCAIEAQIRFAGTPAAWYTVFCANAATPLVNLAFNTASGFFDIRVQDKLSSIVLGTSGAPPAFSANMIWIRALINGTTCDYFTSPDRAVWTPMGGVMGGGSPMTGAASQNPVVVGGGDSFYGFAGWLGDIGRIQTWNDVARTQPGFDFDPSKWVSGTTFVSGGDTWTINSAAIVVPTAFSDGFSGGFGA
jgi:hypothetical protein